MYTGGFPVAFGDRSSGVVDIAPRITGRGFQGEAVASLFSVGASFDGAAGDGATDWAFAARRGNMDVFFDLVDSTLGEPEYHDLYGRVGRRFNDWLAVSASALAFNDEILAFDSDQEEEAVAEYRDEYYWIRADLGAPDGLGGRVLAAHTRLGERAHGQRGPARRRQRHACRRAANSRSIPSRRTAGGVPARARCCRRGSSGATRKAGTTTRTRPSSSSCS